MADGIWVDYTQLTLVNARLKLIIEELEEASSRTDALCEAIGRGAQYQRLTAKVDDFESRWDDRRTDLVEDITKVQEHVQGVLDGLDEWDTETASQMEVDVTGDNTAPRAAA